MRALLRSCAGVSVVGTSPKCVANLAIYFLFCKCICRFFGNKPWSQPRFLYQTMRRTLRRIELTEKVCGVPYAAKNWPKKCAAYPTPHRTGPKSVRRTLRREELAEKVCGVPYAAKNWPKECAAYPTPHRTNPNSVRRRVRRTPVLMWQLRRDYTSFPSHPTSHGVPTA